MCVCVCVCVCAHVCLCAASVIVKRLVLIPCVTDGRYKNLLYLLLLKKYKPRNRA